MIYLEILTILLLFWASISGFMAMQALTPAQRSFHLIHGTQKDYDKAVVYAITCFSTAVALYAMFLRMMWLKDVGWTNAGNKWGANWLAVHSFNGILFSAFHYLIYHKRLKV